MSLTSSQKTMHEVLRDSHLVLHLRHKALGTLKAILFLGLLFGNCGSRVAFANEKGAPDSTVREEADLPIKTKSLEEANDIDRPKYLAEMEFQKFLGRFLELEFEYLDELGNKSHLPYRLHVPPQLVKGKQYPLILWLHGASESGRDNWGQLNHMPLALEDYKENFPAFILAPQKSMKVSWYSGQEGGEPKDSLSAVNLVLEKVLKEHPVDEENISVVGISSGGSACWEMGIRHPGRFSVIAPISSAGGNLAKIKNLSKTWVWTFNNRYDDVASIAGSRQSVNALREMGGQAQLIDFEKYGHDSWTMAFQDYDLFTLLIDKQKRKWFWRISWMKEELLSRIALPAAIVFVLSMAYWDKKRRQNRVPQGLQLEKPEPEGG